MFSGKWLGCLGFSRERKFIGEGAMSVEARGLHTPWRRALGPTHARRGYGHLGAPLRLSFGLRVRVGKNRDFGLYFVQFREYSQNNFSGTKNSRKHELALWHLVNRLVPENV